MDIQHLFETKSDYIYKQIKQNILKGVWKQGQNIIISKVAEELNISTIPVREALKRLEMEGLVDITPHKGARVTTFDSDRIKEVLSIRAVLEGYAARTAIPFIDDKKMAELKQMAEKMEHYAKVGDDGSFSNANKEFHRYLYKQSPFSLLYDMIFKLWDGGNWSKSVFAFKPDRMYESVIEHYKILEAIEEKDGEKAERLIRMHKEKNMLILQRLSKSNTLQEKKEPWEVDLKDDVRQGLL